MNKTEILENLCAYDKRNPDFLDINLKANRETCHCCNCLKGRSKLARELLKYKKIEKAITDDINYFENTLYLGFENVRSDILAVKYRNLIKLYKQL